MIPISQVGQEVFNQEPRKFYVFLGPEYGIKHDYLLKLQEFYGTSVELESISEAISQFSTKSLIPLPDSLYVVRYDEGFVGTLNDVIVDQLKSLRIRGTLVLLYENEKLTETLDKSFPENTVYFSDVAKKFIKKYLREGYPSVPDRLTDIAAEVSVNYYHACMICESMKHYDVNKLFNLTPAQLSKLFGVQYSYSLQDVRYAIAGRNFNRIYQAVKSLDLDVSSFLYQTLSVVLELESLILNRYKQSDIRSFCKYWTLSDVYNLFNQTYDAILKLRTVSSDEDSQFLHVCSLICMSPVPSVESIEV